MKKPKIKETKCVNIPESFLTKLIDFTGADTSTKGFILFYVNADGQPVALVRVKNDVTKMGLDKFVEVYLDQQQS